MSLSGLGTALVTPFHADGSLDLPALSSIVEWQIASGVNFLLPCGSTGEASTLSEEETTQVIQTVVQVAKGRVPVFAGCTHNSTAEAVRRAVAISGIDGVTGILTANPYYSKPTQRGQFLHFKAIAEAVGKAVLLYNIPGRTAANLEPATILELAAIPNIIGVKESSGNLQQIADLIAKVPQGFSVLSGDDYLTLPILASGAAGLVSVASNVVPVRVARMLAAVAEGDWKNARSISQALATLTSALFSEPNPTPAKAMLALMGKIGSDAVRLPLVPVEDRTRERLRGLLADL